MTETLPISSMQHAFAHADEALSLPSPSLPSVTSPPLPPPTADYHHSLRSPPHGQPAALSALDPSPSNPTYSVVPVATDRELTPPLSSAFSIQEHTSAAATTLPNSDKTESQSIVPAAIASYDTGSTRPSNCSPQPGDISREVQSGPKRTASGQIKRSSITSISELKPEINSTRHSRTTSILSNSSNGSVMEVRRHSSPHNWSQTDTTSSSHSSFERVLATPWLKCRTGGRLVRWKK
jgi:hypothetical protein